MSGPTKTKIKTLFFNFEYELKELLDKFQRCRNLKHIKRDITKWFSKFVNCPHQTAIPGKQLVNECNRDSQIPKNKPSSQERKV